MRYILVLPRAIREAMLDQAIREAPAECCGMLIGQEHEGWGIVTERIPLQNQLQSPTAYAVSVRELVDVQRRLRITGQRELAIYHSHPTSEAIPSASDLKQNGYGDTLVHIIISLRSDPPEVLAWWLAEHEYTPAEVLVVDEPVLRPVN